jgi:predicted PhzF superfamily epimerase YddE/YHI9
MSAALRYFIVDAFTARPFTGNPAAVVLLNQWPDDVWLQNVAMEMNLSETAYLVPGDGGYHLRWFTPKVEVDLCGHATLASAAALARLNRLTDGGTVAFSTRSGILTVVRQDSRYQLDFPRKPAVAAAPPPGLFESLGATSAYVGRNQFDYLLEFGTEEELRNLAPNFRELAAVKCRGVIVTAKSDNPQFDFVSRFFAPAAGIDEDPVTGSAHCCLADHWSKRLAMTTLVGYQASARGGVVRVEVRSDRVLLGGEGVVVAEGKLLCCSQ